MATDKKIFAVIAAEHPDILKANIEAQYPDLNLSVGSGQWFLIGPSTLTTQELAIKLGISSEPSISGAIVLSVSSYYGRTQISTWEWLTAKTGDASAIAG